MPCHRIILSFPRDIDVMTSFFPSKYICRRKPAWRRTGPRLLSIQCPRASALGLSPRTHKGPSCPSSAYIRTLSGCLVCRSCRCTLSRVDQCAGTGWLYSRTFRSSLKMAGSMTPPAGLGREAFLTALSVALFIFLDHVPPVGDICPSDNDQ